ncbi:GSU2403 family nucleotidyltransferase fold protein [Burkholderia orbicola]|uniref:GSU2403 family nucleotidyltransferase fold protein n=1 Tax=Burkholderia orbicola TaxID=2978683 RepID=UPI00264BCF15|nr:GSU2403 family nucleotidyltransferase fold protein [Burkholderia orbicola]MDN7993673.1 GSU2403 family nucleotidyltransferase fold protein [Burkholderia orbicola]
MIAKTDISRVRSGAHANYEAQLDEVSLGAVGDEAIVHGYLPLSDNSARQAIDSSAVFSEFCRTKAEASKYAGGMYWKTQGPYEYLVKTSGRNRQKRIGPRSPETEQAYEAFISGRAEIKARLADLQAAVIEAERVNRALRVGRAPAIVVDILRAIERVGLSSYFTVVGTHALYAYEAAAGVRLAQGALATEDVDLLWDAKKHLRLLTDTECPDVSMLSILRRVDKSFRRKGEHLETAINGKGFEVDFLPQPSHDPVPYPGRPFACEEDQWLVQSPLAQILASAPRFEQVVVATTGKMARMSTIDPEVFIDYKTWMAKEAENRHPRMRRRDQLQADIVWTLMEQGLLLSR